MEKVYDWHKLCGTECMPAVENFTKKINCILLIDDDADDNEFHSEVIQKAGVCNKIKIAEDGIKALEYIRKSAIPGMEKEFPKANLIFLDINMPRMNGFEFLKEYHKTDKRFQADIIVSMLTTSLNPDDRSVAKFDNDVFEFARKPLTVEMLNAIAKKYF